MKKKLLFIILIICLMLCFTGCAQVDFTNAYTQNGWYQQIIDVELDDISSTSGNSLDEVRAKVIEIFNGEGYSIIEYENKNKIRAYKNYSTQEAMEEDTLGNGLIKTETTNSNDVFFKYYSTKSDTIFNARSMIKLMFLIRSKYNISIAEFSLFDLYSIKTSYNYLTPYKSVDSDADEITKLGDYYNHKWNMNERESSSINFVVRSPRREIWYAGAIFLAVITVLIISVVNVIKNKLKKHTYKIGGSYGNQEK